MRDLCPLCGAAMPPHEDGDHDLRLLFGGFLRNLSLHSCPRIKEVDAALERLHKAGRVAHTREGWVIVDA